MFSKLVSNNIYHEILVVSSIFLYSNSLYAGMSETVTAAVDHELVEDVVIIERAEIEVIDVKVKEIVFAN